MISIRRAEVTDVPWLLEQLRMFDRFFDARRSLFPSEDYARQFLTMLMDHAFFVACRDENGTPRSRVGFICGMVSAHPFNPGVRVLSELFWWVVPTSRGSSVGARLLLEFEEYGRKYADWIVMSLEEKTIEQNMIDPMSLTMRGYRAKERSYLLEVPQVTV